MRAKLLQGTNSINWAKSVLPRFIGNPQNCQSRETTNKCSIEIQIGTKINRPQTRVVIGFAVKTEYVDRTVVMPGINEKVTWEDRFTEDVGGADFLPKLLDIYKGIAYLVAHPMGCVSYNKWGRPNPPYVIFKYEGKAWQRITLKELPAAIKTPNLIPSSPDDAAKKIGQLIVSAEAIRKMYEEYKQPEYQTILREALPKRSIGITSCEHMIPFGKGGWLGLDWFRDQSTYEACLKFCERKGVNPKDCPCETLFKGAK